MTKQPEKSAAPSAAAPGSADSELEDELALTRKRYVRACNRIIQLKDEIERLKEKRGIDLGETAEFLIDSAENRLRAAEILIAEKLGNPPNAPAHRAPDQNV